MAGSTVEAFFDVPSAAPERDGATTTAPHPPLRSGEVAVVTHLTARPELNWRPMVVLRGGGIARTRVAVRPLLQPEMLPIAVRSERLFRVHEDAAPLTPLKVAVLVKHGMPGADAAALCEHFGVVYEPPAAGEQGACVEIAHAPA